MHPEIEPTMDEVTVTTGGSPNLTGKNSGLLRRIQDRVSEDDPNSTLYYYLAALHHSSEGLVRNGPIDHDW